MVVFWNISNRHPRISLQYPQVCITAIFTKYCYATGRWFLEPMSQYTLLGVLAVRGKSFWNRIIDMALLSGNTFSIGVCVLTKSPPKGFRSWKRVEWMASNLPGWYILTDFRNGYALLIISINPYTEKHSVSGVRLINSLVLMAASPFQGAHLRICYPWLTKDWLGWLVDGVLIALVFCHQ